MSYFDIILLALTALGGVGLFIYGMELMTRALEQAMGHWLRLGLSRISRKPLLGIIGATGISAAIHSGPTTVMIVSFINAGMITLADSIPLILGANIGTTLSMQLVAFHLVEYAPPIIAIGVFLRLVGNRDAIRQVGTLLVGFGLLFIGLELVKTPLPQIRDAEIVKVFAASVSAKMIMGMIIGVILSTVLTSILMSSGAMIAVIFALADEGILSTFEQIFPLILGAHIGTCLLTIIGAYSMSPNAKRSALAHLLFNVIGAIIACLMVKFYLVIIPMTSDNLVRQTANAHTLIQVVNALIFLPFMVPYARLIERFLPVRGEEGETSYLDPTLLTTPEAANMAVMLELRRQARLCARMMREAVNGLMNLDRHDLERVYRTEDAVDSIKIAINDYFTRLGAQRLSGRQSVMAQHLSTCAGDLERIGDHIETVAAVADQRIIMAVWFDEESILEIAEIGKLAAEIIELAVESLNPHELGGNGYGDRLLAKRKDFKRMTSETRSRFNGRLEAGTEKPLNGLLYMRMLDAFDGMMRHIKSIARMEKDDTLEFRYSQLGSHKLDF